MKTSVIDVRDMLSVLSVPGLKKRTGAVPGVDSVTVNYAAGNATVRYDETRLVAGDIKSAVRQAEFQSASESQGTHGGDDTPASVDAGAPSAPAVDAHEGHPAAKPGPPEVSAMSTITPAEKKVAA